MDSGQTSELIIYQSEDGNTKIDVLLDEETVWLTQAQMAELFQTTKQNIAGHIGNIFKENELDHDSVVKESFTTAADGKKYSTNIYNLDMIISVGYRVRSVRGTQFRKWATQRIREYIIKGFTLNDEVLKKAGGGGYFEELLERIRDIRSSEKVFYKKVLDIYATSVDYNPNAEVSKRFFQTVQNKMHWAAHGHTAPELIAERADASKPYMGLTSFTDGKPRRSDITVAKNYLSHDELQILNRMVSAYLEFAEMQAVRRKPMSMKDWIVKLDDFLRMSEYDILNHAGKISREDAEETALAEFEKYRELTDTAPSEVEKHFLQSIDEAAKLVKRKGKGN
jgi:hypothetical protein